MPEFDAITFYVELNGTFTDVTSHLMIERGVRFNIGIMNNGPLDRVGSPENLTFSLKNSPIVAGVSKPGYYTPGHANMRDGWQTGLRVKIDFTFDNITKTKYIGWILPNGIDVEPGTTSTRAVNISCTGFMGKAAEHVLDLLQIQENMTIEQAINYIVNLMPVQPTGTDYGSGASTFPTVFDQAGTNSTAMSEMARLALSELGYVWTKGDGTLVVRGRDDMTGLTDNLVPKTEAESGFYLLEDGTSFYLLEDGTSLYILDETQTAIFDNKQLVGAQTAYGKYFYNRVKVNAYPRRVDAAATTVLWTLQEAIAIPANTTLAPIRGTYRDPNAGSKTVKGTSMVTPVSGTDYKADSAIDGSGSNQTANLSLAVEFGASDFEVTPTNTSGTAIYTGGSHADMTFQVRGKGVYFDDVASTVVNDELSQNNEGVREIIFDMKYQNDPVVARTFAEYFLNRATEKRMTIERMPIAVNRDNLSMMMFMYGEPGVRYPIAEDMSAISSSFFVMGYEVEIFETNKVFWYPTLVNVDEFDFSLFENGYPTITEDFSGADSSELIFTSVSPINSGVVSLSTTITDPACWVVISSSSSSSGASFYYGTESYYTVTNGSLDFELWFRPENADTIGNIGMRGLSGSPEDGIYFNIGASRALTGKASYSSTTTTTGTSYTLTAGTWYRAKFHVNDAGNSILFELFTEYGVLLWDDTVTSNIPPSSIPLNPSIQFTCNGLSGTSSTIAYLDYFTAGFVHD